VSEGECPATKATEAIPLEGLGVKRVLVGVRVMVKKDFWCHDPDSLPKLLHRLGEYHLNSTNRFLKRFNLTVEQAVVLFAVWERSGVNQKELAGVVYKDQANVTRIIKRLIAKDWVEIKGLPADKRVNLVYMTQAGNDFMDKLYEITQKAAAYADSVYDQAKVANMKQAVKEYIQMVVASDEIIKKYTDSIDIG
jgi:DNA-binding MarR family transcriptional regulator